MGACASVPKAMRAEATDAPAPEPPKEETPATEAAEEITVAAEAKEEEVAEKKAEGGDDAKQEEKGAAEVSLNLFLFIFPCFYLGLMFKAIFGLTEAWKLISITFAFWSK